MKNYIFEYRGVKHYRRRVDERDDCTKIKQRAIIRLRNERCSDAAATLVFIHRAISMLTYVRVHSLMTIININFII